MSVAHSKQVKPIKVAVIGGGNMGKNHVRNYAALPDFELVGLADINPETERLAIEHQAAFYADYLEMLDTLRPDAVSIVVPTPLHATVATEVMNRNIHCLLEKPIASTPQEAGALITLAKKKHIIFTIGHIERYNPMVMKLKRLIDHKEIGDITAVTVKRVGAFPTVEPKTDVIIDLAVHDIEIISHLLGRQPQHVYGHGSRSLHSNKIDSAEIFMDYGAASGFIQANWITPIKIRTIAVTGSDGYLEGNYITQELVYYKHSMRLLRDDSFKDFVDVLGEPDKRHITPTRLEEPLANELQAFAHAIRTKDVTGLVDPVVACHALDIALQALGDNR